MNVLITISIMARSVIYADNIYSLLHLCSATLYKIKFRHSCPLYSDLVVNILAVRDCGHPPIGCHLSWSAVLGDSSCGS